MLFFFLSKFISFEENVIWLSTISKSEYIFGFGVGCVLFKGSMKNILAMS
jgi:hypothetical protein